MEPTKFLLGDIVALNSHHFDENQTTILFKGDSMQQSPLMAVTDILLSKREHDSAQRKSNQYKCIWFSARLQRFEQSWFQEPMIKLILRQKEMISEKLPIGAKVIFKTLPLEISKLRSLFSAENENSDSDKRKNILTPLLSFISPVMLISGYKDNKPAAGITFADSQLFKVKWFNAQGDKFSEVFLPVSSLESLPPADFNKINGLQTAIQKGLYVKAKIGFFETFVKPVAIVHSHGFYFLRFYEVVLNAMAEDLPLDKITILGYSGRPYLVEAPLFDLSKSDRPINEVLKVLREARRNKLLIRIKYTNQYGIRSIRCVRDFKIHRISEGEKKTRYLTGTCLVKMAERNFHVGRIHNVEVLDLHWDVALKVESL